MSGCSANDRRQDGMEGFCSRSLHEGIRIKAKEKER